MALYDNEGNWTLEAVDICREINSALKPILEKVLDKEMSHSDFCYMVNSEVELLILENRRHKRMKDRKMYEV